MQLIVNRAFLRACLEGDEGGPAPPPGLLSLPPMPLVSLPDDKDRIDVHRLVPHACDLLSPKGADEQRAFLLRRFPEDTAKLEELMAKGPVSYALARAPASPGGAARPPGG